MNFQEFFRDLEHVKDAPWLRKHVRCPDGFTISIQASEYSYCSPRVSDSEWYNEVECGYPSSDDLTNDLMRYAEDSSDYTNTVYGYVPVSVVIKELSYHGMEFTQE